MSNTSHIALLYVVHDVFCASDPVPQLSGSSGFKKEKNKNLHTEQNQSVVFPKALTMKDPGYIMDSHLQDGNSP